MNTIRYTLSLLVVFSGLQSGLAAAERPPAKMRIAILFKALTYDYNLATRCGDSLRIGVVGLADSESSARVAQETFEEIEGNSARRVKGLKIMVESLMVKSAAEVKKMVAEKNLNTLYLGPGLGKMLQPILDLAREQKLLVLTAEVPYVKAGVALGVYLQDQKAKILINIKAAEAQGASFDARLLRLAEVIQ